MEANLTLDVAKALNLEVGDEENLNNFFAALEQLDRVKLQKIRGQVV